MKEPANIGKTTNSVNQGKEFVVKTRYTWTRKTRARKDIIFSSTGFVGKQKIKCIQVSFSRKYQ